MVRRLVGGSGTASIAHPERLSFTERPKRGGGFVLEVNVPVESLAAGDAAVLRELLEAQLARVRARLDYVRHGSTAR